MKIQEAVYTMKSVAISLQEALLKQKGCRSHHGFHFLKNHARLLEKLKIINFNCLFYNP